MNSEIKIEAGSVNLNELLKKKKFLIPSFQRFYSWDEKNIEDILNVFLKQNYEIFYLNSIILSRKKKNDNQYFVIDGQQRLITIFLILKGLELILNNRLKELEITNTDNDKHVIDISKLTLKCIKLLYLDENENIRLEISRGQKIFNFILNAKDYNQIILLKKTVKNEIEKRFLNNFLRIKKIIEKNKDIFSLISIFNYLSQKTIFIEQIVPEKISRQIFENINAKNKPLTDYDLTRVFLETKINEHEKKDQLRKQINNTEDKIIKKITLINEKKSVEKIRDFMLISLNVSFSHKLNEFISFKKKNNQILYKTIKNSINLLNIEELLQEFDKDADLLLTIFEANKKQLSDEIRKRIIHIKRVLEINYGDYVILSALKYLTDKEKKEEILKKLEYFLFFYRTILGETTKVGEICYDFAKTIKDIRDEKQAVNKILKKMKEIFEIENNRFKEQFMIKSFSRGKTIKYILKEYLDINNKDLEEELTIEHIMPQTIDEKNKKYYINDSSIRSAYLNKIGNLTLLENNLNIKNSNDIPYYKNEVYKKSKIEKNREIFSKFALFNNISELSWKETEINKRTKDIVDFWLNKLNKEFSEQIS